MESVTTKITAADARKAAAYLHAAGAEELAAKFDANSFEIGESASLQGFGSDVVGTIVGIGGDGTFEVEWAEGDVSTNAASELVAI